MRSQRLSFPGDVGAPASATPVAAAEMKSRRSRPVLPCIACSLMIQQEPLTVNDRGVINAPRSSSKTNLAVASGTLRARLPRLPSVSFAAAPQRKCHGNKLIPDRFVTGQTDFPLVPTINRGVLSEETTMGAIGAAFQPELISMMKAVLDDAAATLPEWKRTSTTMAEMASQILGCAARGERDPAALKIAALMAVVERSHYSHDISPERRAV